VNPLPKTLITIVLLLAAFAPAMVAAQAEDVYSEQTLEIARKLQCPICAGETVADSQTMLARQMREVIEQKVQAGESEQQILDYFVARYTETVLTAPPKSGFTLTLWWAPVAVLLLGGLVAALYMRERRGAQHDQGRRASDDDELEALAREALAGDTSVRKI
jgi:cytochrome c-type biogenesis protein CcmH